MASTHPSRLRAILWIGCFAIAFVIVSILITSFPSLSKVSELRGNIGLDFVAFYRPGVLIRTGQANLLYDLQNTRDFDRALARDQHLALGNTFGLFLNPPFFALIFVPVAALGYSKALLAWYAINIACFIAAAVMIIRLIPSRNWRDRALAPALMIVSLPFIQTIGHAQNTFISLLLVTCVATAWRQGRAFAAGILVGILFYKPQLAAVILAAMLLTLGWRALAGAALSLASLLLINILTLPGTLTDYLHRLGPDVQYMLSTHPYLWARHATFNGFWHVLLPNSSSLAQTLAILCSLPVAIALLHCIWVNRNNGSRDRVIAAAIGSAPLLMPYYLDYDLLLLAVPAVLLAGEMIQRDPEKALPARDLWLIRLFIALFLLLLINPGLTGTIHINLSVPLLASIALLFITRAIQSAPEILWDSLSWLVPASWTATSGGI